ncbi:MAG: VOC family protein [Isosphaeraceae bacterium]
MDHTICHFEIPVDDLPKAASFYKELFGWDINPWGGPDAMVYMVSTVPTDEKGTPVRPGVNGMLIKKQNPQHPFANYILVEDIDAYTEKLVALGGKVALPKTAVPNMGWFMYFMDPDNNILGLWQADPSASA